MRTDPRMLLRGVGKFVVVAILAGLGGAAIGIGLAALTGSDKSDSTASNATTAAPAITTAQTQTTTQTQTQATTQTTTQTTGTAPTARYLVPKVTVASATLSPADASGRAAVNVRLTVTNRGSSPIASQIPRLVSDADDTPLHSDARKAAGPLLAAIAPGKSATGTLRFPVSGAVAKRLAAARTAKLRIAKRTIALALSTAG